MNHWQLALQQLGTPARDVRGYTNCKYCGKGFQIPRNTNKMFCSPNCRHAYRYLMKGAK